MPPRQEPTLPDVAVAVAAVERGAARRAKVGVDNTAPDKTRPDTPQPVLRVLAGRHAGASVAWDGQALLIGSDERCDLVLSDAGVLCLHAVISREPDGLRLKLAPGASARIDDELIEPTLLQTRLPLRDGQPVALGEACLVFDGTGACDTPVLAGEAAEPPRETEPGRVANGGRAGRLRAGALLRVAAFGTALSFGAALFMLGLEGLSPAAVAQPRPMAEPAASERLAQLQQRLLQIGLTDLRGVEGERGQLRIEGFVADLAQARRLQADAPLAALQPWRARYQIGASTAAAIEQLIDARSVSAAYHGAGLVVLSGQAADARVQTRVQRIVKELGRGLEIEDRIAYPVKNDAAGVDDTAEADPAGRSGTPRSGTQAAKAWKPAPKLSSVVTGNPAYVETVEGKRYFEGSKLADGSEIVAIGPAGVTLRRDGRLAQWDASAMDDLIRGEP